MSFATSWPGVTHSRKLLEVAELLFQVDDISGRVRTAELWLLGVFELALDVGRVVEHLRHGVRGFKQTTVRERW